MGHRGDIYPESSEVGGVVAVTCQESAWTVSFKAAISAPFTQSIVPESTGEAEQRRVFGKLKS